VSTCLEYFASGHNNFGQLGLNLIQSELSRFTSQTQFFEGEFAVIRAGQRHAFAVNKDGKAFGWGDNSYGQISQDENLTSSSKPIPLQFFVDNNIKLVRVDGGNYHSIALDTEGNVWTWGRNVYG